MFSNAERNFLKLGQNNLKWSLEISKNFGQCRKLTQMILLIFMIKINNL